MGYSDNDNTWVHESDVIDKTLITRYIVCKY